MLPTRHAAVLATLMLASAAPATAAPPDGTVVHVNDIEWKPLTPRQEVGGPLMHVLWGNPGKGAGEFLLKLPGDGVLPLRTHAAQYSVLVVSGTWLHAVGDGEFVQVQPGGYWTQPAKQQHRDRCLAGPECIVLIRTQSKFDLARLGMGWTRDGTAEEPPPKTGAPPKKK